MRKERRLRILDKKTRTAGQAELLPSVIDEGIEPYREILKKRRRGERYTEAEQEAVLRVVAMYEGNTWRAGKALEGIVSVGSMWEIVNRNEGAFSEARERWKQTMARNLQRLASRMGEKLAEAVETQTPSVRDLSIALGVVTDKTGILAGDAITVQHVHRVDETALRQLSERLAELRHPTEESPVEIEGEWRVVSEE